MASASFLSCLLYDERTIKVIELTGVAAEFANKFGATLWLCMKMVGVRCIEQWKNQVSPNSIWFYKKYQRNAPLQKNNGSS